MANSGLTLVEQHLSALEEALRTRNVACRRSAVAGVPRVRVPVGDRDLYIEVYEPAWRDRYLFSVRESGDGVREDEPLLDPVRTRDAGHLAAWLASYTATGSAPGCCVLGQCLAGSC